MSTTTNGKRVRKTEVSPAATPPEESATAATLTTTSPTEPRKPLKLFSIKIGKDVYIQASVWDDLRERQDGEVFMTYSVSLRKRYKNRQGQWASYYSFQPSETYVLFALVQQANAYIAQLYEELPNE